LSGVWLNTYSKFVYTNLYTNIQSIFILCVLGGASTRLEEEEQSEES
jgi:hypothetical protein